MPFFLISIALHLALFSLMNEPLKIQKASPPSPPSQPIKIHIHTLGSSKQKGNGKSSNLTKGKGSGKECKDYYYGIGVVTGNSLSNKKGCEITGIAAFSPASEANLEVGDTIIALDGGCIFRGEKDSLVTFQLIKKYSGETKFVTLTRKKICTSQPE